MGLGRASELLFTDDDIGDKKAELIGLVNRCVPAETLNEEAEEAGVLAQNWQMELRELLLQKLH